MLVFCFNLEFVSVCAFNIVCLTLQEISEPAAEALVNLSQDSVLAEKMVEMGMIKTAMDMLYKPESSIRQLLVMLLVNLTQLDAGITSLLQVCFPKLNVIIYLPIDLKGLINDL